MRQKIQYITLSSLLFGNACQSLPTPIPQKAQPQQAHSYQQEATPKTITPKKLKLKYPEEHYITEHVIAFTGPPHRAEDEAKNRVSARIKSEISSEYLSFQAQISANQGTESFSKESSQIRLTTDFKYAELIQIDPDAKHCEMRAEQTQCDAFAYLDRRQAVDRYLSDWQPKHIKLGQLLEQAIQPQISNKEFLFLYPQIQLEFQPWLESAFQIEMLSPGFIKDFDKMKKAVYGLEKRKNDILQSFKITLLPAQINQPQIATQLNHQLNHQLSHALKIKTQQQGQCPKTGLALVLKAQLEERDHQQLLGKKMLLLHQITLSLIDCTSNQIEKEVSLDDIRAYEVLNRSLIEQMQYRLQKEVFQPNEKGNLYEQFNQQLKALLSSELPL